MKKAILIQPPIEDFYYTFIRTYPLNLCYLATFLENHGIDVEIFDFIDGSKKIIPTPTDFENLKKYYLPWDKSPYSLFKHFQRFGYSYEKCESVIKEMNADYFLIPSNFTAYFNITKEIASLIKKYHKNSKIITGGYHASSVPNKVLKTNLFDYVIVGEGEYGLYDVLNGEENKLIIAKQFKEFEEFIPNRKYLNNKKYVFKGKKMASMTLSRGCPMRCEFCTIHSVYKNTYRKRKLDSIIEEIEILYKNYNIKHFDFEDDNLYGDFLNKILNSIRNLNLKDCSFSAMNGIPYLSLNEKTIKTMKEVGFEHLDISFATNKNVMKRVTDKEKFVKVVKLANKYKLPVNAYFILGLPGMSFNENLEIIKFLGKLDVNIGPSVYYSVPGIPFYNEDIKDINCRGTAAYLFRESTLSQDEVLMLFRICRAINFLKKENKTDFEKLVEEKTRILGLQLIKKQKNNYQFKTIENSLDILKKVLC